MAAAAKEAVPGIRRITVTGKPVDLIPEKLFPEAVEKLFAGKGVRQVLLVNVWDLMRSRWNFEYRRSLRDAALVVPISKGIEWGAKFQRKAVPQRYQPFDFMVRLLAVLEGKSKTVYLLGGKQKELQIAETNLKETFPGVRLIGRYTGFFPSELEATIITAIKKASPDLIFIGRGVAGGDSWVSRNKDKFNPGIFIYCPESFDVFSNRRKRVSKSLFIRGLDFLPALIRRPWRFFRIFVYIYYFFMLIFYRIYRM